MENYIVRIYGRDSGDSDRVTGVLESVEQETRRPFHSLDALRSMLGAPSAGAPERAAPRSRPGSKCSVSHMPSKTTRRFDN
jgi:hypothetical protein